MPSSEQLTLSFQDEGRILTSAFEGGLDKMPSDEARAAEDEKVHPASRS